MGVPKFFRYISERYPCLSELARDQCIPEFDHLYLDMNGIIHNCSHPDDNNIHFHLEEEEIIKGIFNYISKLFYLIKPQKLFFMAVDGVAPRAKMNQQRSRRFRSAKEAEQVEHQASLRGEKRTHDRFDSNCITPGTEFMARLQNALRYFVKSKISQDPLWQNCRIILSGHDTPGEGEHKIMDYIRYLKSQPDFDPNTRHCLYGLDADLIILGLCTHELHFVILREEVTFGRKKAPAVEETRFFLLHLGLLREYLELEFDELRKQNAGFDIAKMIDDWVLMGFLVGNDFVPNLPCLHINSDALTLLYKTYIKVYSELGGNINEYGKLNLERLEKYFVALSEVEYDLFEEHYADLQYFNAKLSKNGIDEAFDVDVEEIKNNSLDKDLSNLIETSSKYFDLNDDKETTVAEHISDEFENYKRNYYRNKFKMEFNDDVQQELSGCYIKTLQWILDYYYHGVQSWGWYYPHHYSPFISDLRNFQHHKINFDMGTAFRPFEQLLGVLPAASKNLLPAAYRDLMTSPTSEIINYFPDEFESDLNGKKNDWEAVVLIPFIDEKCLLSAMAKCESKLTLEEVQRNTHGPMRQYEFISSDQGESPGVYTLKPIYHVFCTESTIWSKEIAIGTSKTACVELENSARHVFFPGFPTMRNLAFDYKFKSSRVKVFEFPSRNPSIILMPNLRPELCDAAAVAKKFLNQVVYISWPHLIKAKVVQVSDSEQIFEIDRVKENRSWIFNRSAKIVEEHMTGRMGIQLSNFSVLLQVRIHKGTSLMFRNHGKILLKDAWSSMTTTYPAQCIVSELAVQEKMQHAFNKIEELFTVNSKIFFIGSPYYGSEGTVLDPMLVYKCGRLQVSIVVRPEPNFTAAEYLQNELESDYDVLYAAFESLELSKKCLNRLMGSVMVIPGARRAKPPDNVPKLNIGLQIKKLKTHEGRAGYSYCMDNQWYYSSKAVELTEQYYQLFPEIVHFLTVSSGRNDVCFEEDIYPNNVGEKRLEKICAWLKAQDHIKAELIPSDSKTLEKETIENMLQVTAEIKNMPVKTVKLQVKPHLLLKPNVTLPEVYNSKRELRLFDRVVVVRTSFAVPIGAKGTIIGILSIVDPNPVRLECINNVEIMYRVLFDQRMPNCGDIYGIAEERVYTVSGNSLLLIVADDTNLQKPLPPFKNKCKPRSQSQPQPQPQMLPLQNTALEYSLKSRTNLTASTRDPSANSWRSMPSANAPTNQPRSFSTSTSVPTSSSTYTNNKVNHHFRLSGGQSDAVASGSKQNAANDTVLMQKFVNHLQRTNETQPEVLPTANLPTAIAENQQQTLALKSLLGLARQVSSSPPVVVPQKISVATLPQPPIFWQREALQQSNAPASAAVPRNETHGDLSPNMSALELTPHWCKLPATPPKPLAPIVTESLQLIVNDVVADAKTESGQIDEQPQARAPRRKRVPKIGAKFDFAK